LNIERSKNDRWIRGVCGGVAHANGWDSNVVRIIKVVAFAVYLILSFVLPESEEF
jgi:phage shock protein PspC (stress-responsive transcriptional regulator)